MCRSKIVWTDTSPLQTMDRYIPSTKKHSRLPWINRPLLRLLRQKKRQYQKARTTQDWTKYRSIQKRCKREIIRAEWRHINSTIQEGLDNNTKPFWNFVKARRKDNVGVSPLKVNGRLFSSPENKAEILLKQFKSVFSSDNDNLPPNTKATNAPPIQPIKISSQGVAKLLQPRKAPGVGVTTG